MKTRRTTAWWLIVLSLLLCRPGVADPRWWWDDTHVFRYGDGGPLDLDVVPPVTPGDPPTIFFPLMVENNFILRESVSLIVSFDGGCSFCGGDVGNFDMGGGMDHRCAIAVAPLAGAGTYSIAILCVDPRRNGDGAILFHDSVTVPLQGTTQERCEALRRNISRNVLRVQLADGDVTLGHPDIAVVEDPAGPPRFHAVWQQGSAGSDDVYYARDLTGTGSGWEALGSLTDTTPPSLHAVMPRVTADRLHGGPSGSSAVSVSFVDISDGGIYYLRSTDSGTTFSATGAPPAGPPVLVNDQLSWDVDGPLAMDSGAIGTGTTFWHAAAWFERPGGNPRLLLDAQRQVDPAVASPAWQVPDLAPQTIDPLDTEEPALAVLPEDTNGDAPLFLLWTDVRDTLPELFYRGGFLEAAAPQPVNLDLFPIRPVRPLDPDVSVPLQLTRCDWDEGTGGCIPNRVEGAPTSLATDVCEGEVWTLWLDVEQGDEGIWIKRTDRSVDCVRPSIEASCDDLGAGRITITWAPLATCASDPPVPEKIARYLVCYGTDPGGPYPDCATLPDDGALPDPVAEQIDGLPLGTTFYAVVVPEDEARNLCPETFDPHGDLASYPDEVSATTPPSCGPPCLHRKVCARRDTTGVFMARSLLDISFTEPERSTPYGPCPFPSGDPDPQPVLDPLAPPLIFYQHEGDQIQELRIRKDVANATVRIDL